MSKRKFRWKQDFYVFESEAEQAKYIGKNKPYYRSGLEENVMFWLSKNSNVLKWSNEQIIVPYFIPNQESSDGGKWHKYFVDFYAELINREGILEKLLIEVKPAVQCSKPIAPKNNNQKAQQRYKSECYEFIKNQLKWKFASDHAQKQGWHFVIVTEKNLPQKNRRK